MIEIRIHGRGGQGAVIASKVLASAFFKEGKYVQAFPAFGVERRGAPVAAFARVSGEKIWLRCEIYEPDYVIVLDPALMEAVDVGAGLKENGWVVINSDLEPDCFNLPPRFRTATVDATKIALKYRLGSRSAPIVNTAILGAFSKITEIVGIDSIVEAVREAVPVSHDENEAATREAYRVVKT